MDSGKDYILAAWADVLDDLGRYEDLKREELQETPRRIRDGYGELLRGYQQDPRKILSKVFKSQLDQMVVVQDIEFYSMCEHHFLPIFGYVHVAYIPKGWIVGVSKIARLVDCFARRLQVQERLTEQIAHALMEALRPEGVGVVVEGQHLCMMARGIQKQGSRMVTSCMLGAFRNVETKNEFLAFCQLHGRRIR